MRSREELLSELKKITLLKRNDFKSNMWRLVILPHVIYGCNILFNKRILQLVKPRVPTWGRGRHFHLSTVPLSTHKTPSVCAQCPSFRQKSGWSWSCSRLAPENEWIRRSVFFMLCVLGPYIQLVFVEFDVDFLVLFRPYDPRAVNLRNVDIISLKIFMRRKLTGCWYFSACLVCSSDMLKVPEWENWNNFFASY